LAYTAVYGAGDVAIGVKSQNAVLPTINDDYRFPSSNTSRSSLERSPSRYCGRFNACCAIIHRAFKQSPKVRGFAYKSRSAHGREVDPVDPDRAYTPTLSHRMSVGALGLLLMGSPVNAEVTQFRPGGLVVWLFNVLGFNVIDLTSAIPDMVYLFLLLGLGYIVYRMWFK
jgi:hypothetical protein